MNLLITPPFDSPIAPKMLEPQELASILAEHGIHVTDDPKRADLELVGGVQLWTGPDHCRLPHDRVVLIDGEPPQPEYLLPHYTVDSGHFAHVITPLNGAYAYDCMAFYRPPLEKRPRPEWKGGRVCQLATYRTRGGNANGGSHLVVQANGKELYAVKVLCVDRVKVALELSQRMPGMVDIYGRGWPNGIAKECSRNRSDFIDVRREIVSQYDIDLDWENTQIPGYVTEKYWETVRLGVLPAYWGPEGFYPHGIDCRDHLHAGKWIFSEYDDSSTEELRYTIRTMGDFGFENLSEMMLDWYYDLPTDSAHRSWIKSAHTLANRLLKVAERVGA